MSEETRSDNLDGSVEAVDELSKKIEQLRAEIRKQVIGQDVVVTHLLVGLLARGHCLMIGVPGLAKTLLISTLASALDLKFSRIQFTPDLMPSDITGTEVMEDKPGGKRSFRFIPGPIFGNVILADEINRTPPKTQAALLQAMQEYKVTCAGKDYPLEPPFFVLATQNPIEQEGIYPLPEAQLDRFMLNIMVDYPDIEEEREILRHTTVDTEAGIEPVLTGQEILKFQRLVRRCLISQHVSDYILKLVRATRPGAESSPTFVGDWVAWGAGPRAAQHLALAAKAYAILHGRCAMAVARSLLRISGKCSYLSSGTASLLISTLMQRAYRLQMSWRNSSVPSQSHLKMIMQNIPHKEAQYGRPLS